MSLEEFGDLQLKDALERQVAEKEAATSSVQTIRRYNQLEEAGDEDDEVLVDAATTKDREWDEWREDNPKGWGNKAGKRY